MMARTDTMISRRSFVASSAALSAGMLGIPASSLVARSKPEDSLDPLETMIRLRSRTDGALSIAWLDAQREIMLDGEISPFCRLFALVLTKFRKDGDAYVGSTVEITYYCDPVTGELLETATLPSGTEPVEVPIYRTGPMDVRFKGSLDEWEQHDPAVSGSASEAFAPASSVHLVRGVHDPYVQNENIYLRADEYGRVYTDLEAPPIFFYREWIVWEAEAQAVLDLENPDVPSSFSYSAASGLRPWMKLASANGHTISNGVGGKISHMGQLHKQHVKLLELNDPRALEAPETYFS